MTAKWLGAAIAMALVALGLSPSYSQDYNGFLYSNGQYSTLMAPGSSETLPESINNSGQIVGEYVSDGVEEAFLYSDGVYTTLDVPGSSVTAALGINNLGDITGYYTVSGAVYGYIYSNGSYTTLNVPDSGVAGAFSVYTEPYSINDQGDVVGIYQGLSTNTSNGFLYINGNYSTIEVHGSLDSGAYGINNLGQIVGGASIGGGTAYIYSGGIYTFLDPGIALGINNLSQVVGITVVDGEPYSYLYDDGSYTPINMPGFYTEVSGINDLGEIVGDYYPSPVPEPSTWAMMLLGFAGLGCVRYRQRQKLVGATNV